MRLGADPTPGENFRGHLGIVKLPNCTIGTLGATVQSIARTPADVAIENTDNVVLFVNQGSQVIGIEQDNKSAECLPGAAVLIEQHRPSTIRMASPNALTDHLLRYRYKAGEDAPTSQPEVLATFPDYGLSYKYGGWHLTRTVHVGGNGKIYVAVGSSCNACEEKEPVRASILEMDPDGRNQRHFARGLRNAVGLRWIKDGLVATNMGSDHLGDHKPADTMYRVRDGGNFGWPYCYQSGPGRFPDPKFNPGGQKLNCREIPAAYVAFDAHSSPLGFEYFDARANPELSDSYLVALHGSTKKSLKRGYRVVRVREGSGHRRQPEDFITGFLQGAEVNGRPVDILKFGEAGFLLTDDYAGVVYYVYRK